MTIGNLCSRPDGRRSYCWCLLTLLVAALAFGYPAAGQEPDALSSSEVAFGEEIDVRVVNLEVVVEDGEGDRVSGLAADDFLVLVDGEEVEVEYFTEVSRGRARPTSGADVPPAVGDGEVVATNYVLFVDDERSLRALRRPVLRGFADRLGLLDPADRVAVVVQNDGRLALLSPFTTDRGATSAALEELDRGRRFRGLLDSRRILRTFTGGGGGTAAYFRDAGPQSHASEAAADLVARGGGISAHVDRNAGGEALLDSRAVVSEGLGAAGAIVASDLVFANMKPDSFEQEARASILEQDLSLSVDAVVSTMRALDPPEGRKVLLLLPGYWPTGEFRPSGRGAGLRTDLQLLDGLIDTANLLGYTIYPMDQQTGSPNMRLWQNLRYVARDTGGMAFMAGSNISALELVASDTSNFYWLGFAPEYRRDDRVREIEVQVQHPGVQVRARRGYLDLSRATEADMEAQRHLLFPQQTEEDVARLRVRTGATRSLRGKRMNVPVDVAIPIGTFTAVPWDGRYVQRLEVRFATIDHDGWRAEQPAIPLDLRHDTAPSPDSVHWFRADVEMRHLPHSLVVTVHDPVSRQTASARIEVKP
ncbi:MAG: VWA domain-containing protein [Holophagales bacterium]|nr:VWA domain-containing protein [Holophagales bacterium]MYD22360.1 VWA domain-containing protein [Holophagales bacterium]MYI34100.1 VWA domain-containing protein [Holophagales bacterium]